MSRDNRIARQFQRLRRQRRSGLIAFVTAGDPTPDLAQELLNGLPAGGADLIELGVPFSDPMADGPAIQASSRRALKHGQTLAHTLDMVATFRRSDQDTPVILFGYYNPILSYGIDRFSVDAATAGVDGLIVVDLPPEENSELEQPARGAGMDVILLVAPTTDDQRLETILTRASGFVYSIAVSGVTGTRSAAIDEISGQVHRIRCRTDLPVAVGFGIKTPEQAAAVAGEADAAVVGSALVSAIASRLSEDGTPKPGLVAETLSFVRSLADAVSSSPRSS